MPDINPLTNNQIFLKKISENTGSDYETGDVSEINPLTIDQIFLKEIAANTAGQAGDITELEEKVTANTSAIEATQDMLSDAYDSTQTYNVGDYCIYNNILYKCNTAIATPEAFTPAKWDAVTVAHELRELAPTSVSVTDNNETWAQLLERLYASVDWSKVTPNSYIYEAPSGTAYRSIFRIQYYAPLAGAGVNYINTGVAAGGATTWRFTMYPSYVYDIWEGGVRTDMSSQSAGGSTLVLVY